MMQTFTVYAHTNKKTGEKYIGITSGKPETRWNRGKGYKGNKRFYSAICAYGWDGFEHEIIARNLTKDEAMQMEQTLIEQYKTVERGYNNSAGGQYAAKGYLTGEARLVLNGMRATGIQEFQQWISWLSHADKSGTDASVLNVSIHYAVRILQDGTLDAGARPQYADPWYLCHVIHVMSWLLACRAAVIDGTDPPKYVTVSQTVYNAIFKGESNRW